VYHRDSNVSDLLHQLGVPAALCALPTAPLALVSPVLAIPAVVGIVMILGLAVIDVARVRLPRTLPSPGLGYRARIAMLHLLQPVVRAWGHRRHVAEARKELPAEHDLPPVVRRVRDGIIVPDDRPRAELAAAAIDEIRRRGVRALASSGWDDYDARLRLSGTVFGDLQTSSHPVGWAQVRIRPRLRVRPLALVAVVTVLLATTAPPLAAILAVFAGGSVVRGLWRANRLLARTFARSAAGDTSLRVSPVAPATLSRPATAHHVGAHHAAARPPRQVTRGAPHPAPARTTRRAVTSRSRL
jgi:hypothetical protein